MSKNEALKRKVRISSVVFWVVLAIIAIYAVVALTSSSDGIRSIFGQSALTVQTNSMSPTFDKGDLIYIDTEFNPDDILVGDVITYQALLDVNDDGEFEWVFNSHRVVDIQDDINGYHHYYTQGDNNALPDSESVHENLVIGVWNEKVTKNIGSVLDGIIGFLKSGTGFFIFIVVPAFAFLIYEIIRFVGVMTEYKTQQALADRVKTQEEALAAARELLEAEARRQAEEAKIKE